MYFNLNKLYQISMSLLIGTKGNSIGVLNIVVAFLYGCGIRNMCTQGHLIRVFNIVVDLLCDSVMRNLCLYSNFKKLYKISVSL